MQSKPVYRLCQPLPPNLRASRAPARAFGASQPFNTFSNLTLIRAFYAYMYAIVMYALVEMV